ncbi:MAG TPA: molybdopterin cofactor-binding domain-containing protein [Gaiellaceae bacterium]|nr:molybdopterin cofactor-binding domain-containing protein [Gaiellaceae bacterium]
MTGFLHEKEFSRKSFLKGTGGVVVGASLASAGLAAKANAAFVPSPSTYNPPTNAVDSFLYVNPDNTINLLTSQVEIGNGTPTGFLMIAAEELDVDFGQMRYGSSVYDKDGALIATITDGWRAVNTGGHGGSQAIQSVGQQVRAAAATAKQQLLSLASKQLGVPVSSLSVSKGVVSGGGKSVTYADLVAANGGKIGGTMSPTSLQPGAGISKPVANYAIVTKVRLPREDIPAKVSGRYTYVHNIRLPGMLHARWVRPRGQGPWLTDGFATPLSVDERSIAHIPNVRVVRRNNFLAVVGPKEYDVIQAAEQLKVKWADTPIMPGHDNVWSYYRAMDAKGLTPARITANTGDVEKAFAGAAKVVSASFAYAFQGHTPIGPACAVADVRADRATVYCNTQNVPNLTTEMAQVLGLPANMVRIIWHEGSSTFGNGYHAFDIAESAALISQLVKAPVRLQLMRWDEQGWTRYGQGYLTDMKAGLDSKGNMVAYQATQINQPSTSLAAARVLIGEVPGTPGAAGTNGENLGPFYKVSATNYRTIAKTVTQQLGMFQQGTLRAPSGPQTVFASEQFIDMLAKEANMDPFTFRAQNMKDEEWRWTAVLKAAIDASPYKPHVPASQLGTGDVVEGWGLAIGTHGASRAGTVAHVEVNKKTGKVRVIHLYAGQDSGLAVNPGLIENQMSGNLVQATSKVLHEELRFDKKRVTSTDWISYPILRFKDAPAVTTVVVQRTDQNPTGSGEPPLVPAIAAIANAVYDAIGVRIFQAPITPARVRGALAGDKPGF